MLGFEKIQMVFPRPNFGFPKWKYVLFGIQNRTLQSQFTLSSTGPNSVYLCPLLRLRLVNGCTQKFCGSEDYYTSLLTSLLDYSSNKSHIMHGDIPYIKIISKHGHWKQFTRAILQAWGSVHTWRGLTWCPVLIRSSQRRKQWLTTCVFHIKACLECTFILRCTYKLKHLNILLVHKQRSVKCKWMVSV